MTSTSTLLLTKADAWGERALAIVRGYFPDTIALTDGPETVAASVDYLASESGAAPRLISFIYGSIVPAAVLAKTSLAINFHPGSRFYPGTGCYNFALYDGAADYGCVCHAMAAKADTGVIFAERIFPIMADETVRSLRERTLTVMLELLDITAVALAAQGTLMNSGLAWERTPYTRRELDDLCEIRSDMDADEVRRRVRATRYPGYPGAHINLHGIRFIDAMSV